MRPRYVLLSIAALAAIATGGRSGLAAEEILADPTLPPRAKAAPAPNPAEGHEVEPAAQPDPVVNAIWAVGQRRYAILDGVTRVEVGDKVGERKVVRIGDNEVVLVGDSGEKVLMMNREIEKTVRTAKPTGASSPLRTASKTEKGK